VKPDPIYLEATRLRHYIEAVAVQVGVEPTAAWSDYGIPSTAYVALADSMADYPDRLLMLQWGSDRGWCLALEPERGEDPYVLAAWPDPIGPEPADLAARVRHVLRPAARTTAMHLGLGGGMIALGARRGRPPGGAPESHLKRKPSLG
jgi:Family of unknown function (DUF6292)